MKRLKLPSTYIWQLKEWPQLSWRAEALLGPLSQARKAQGRLIQIVTALGISAAKNSHAEILTEEAITTAAIEGETLSRLAVRSSVARRLGLPTAGLPATDRNIEGLVDVLQDATSNHAKPLTVARLKSWQAALFPTGYSGLYKIRVGQWRGEKPMQVVSGPMGNEQIHFEAPPSKRLPREMDRFINWWNRQSSLLDGLIRAGVAHFYFVTLHPFEDGNGRLARALTDMALAQDEKLSQRFYSLSARIIKERNQYYDVLESCQKGDLDITAWLEWFLGCFSRALSDSEILIERTLKKAQFWHQFAEINLNVRQRKVVNKLLEMGPDGFEGGLNTRKYTSMTKSSRATAFREISDLVEKGILTPLEGRGRNVAYQLIWPGKL